MKDSMLHGMQTDMINQNPTDMINQNAMGLLYIGGVVRCFGSGKYWIIHTIRESRNDTVSGKPNFQDSTNSSKSF